MPLASDPMPADVAIEATSRTLRRVVADPITWLPFLPFAAAYSFLGTPWWICAAGAVAAGTGVVAWWRRHWTSLRTDAEITLRRDQVQAENLRIERTLGDLTPRLPDRCGTAFRLSLPNFLANKRHVDAAIFEDNRVTPVEAEIGTMVGDLATAWLADLDRLATARLGDAEMDRLRDSVEKGITAMQKTRAEIDTLIRPSQGLDPALKSAAAERAQRLEDRLAEARLIRDRLVRDLQPGISPDPPTDSNPSTSTQPLSQ